MKTFVISRSRFVVENIKIVAASPAEAMRAAKQAPDKSFSPTFGDDATYQIEYVEEPVDTLEERGYEDGTERA